MQIIIIVILVVLSAFFSATETSLSSVNKIRLKSIADNGNRAAARTLKILDKYDKALTTILIGNNIVNIATSSIATILAVSLLGEQYGSLVSTIVTTIVVLIFGEVLPKSIAKDFAEPFAMFASSVLSVLMAVFTPFSAFFIVLKKGVSRLFRRKETVSMTEEELKVIIDETVDEGVLETQEGNLVRSALEFDEITVDEIITPRVRITAVDKSEDIEKVRKKFLTEEYSRMPVYDRTLDNIIGVITEKEFFKQYEKKKNFTVESIMQETLYLPQMQTISEAFRTMQKHKCHLCVVLDQHGGTLGIITMEDILEELVGEIWDESDEVKSPVIMVGSSTFEVYGEVSLNSLRRFFNSRDISARIESEAHTVAGWVLGLFGSIPRSGDVTETDGFRITVLDAAELRVNRIRIEITDEKKEEDS